MNTQLPITGLRHHDYSGRLDELYEHAPGQRMSISIEHENVAEPDADVRQALADLYEATCGEDQGEPQPLFQDQAQWYAVYRVLTVYCCYPAKMSDFARLVAERGYAPARPSAPTPRSGRPPSNTPAWRAPPTCGGSSPHWAGATASSAAWPSS